MESRLTVEFSLSLWRSSGDLSGLELKPAVFGSWLRCDLDRPAVGFSINDRFQLAVGCRDRLGTSQQRKAGTELTEFIGPFRCMESELNVG